MKKNVRRLSAVVAVSTLILAGCQDNPEEPIVQNKDFDNMIEQAQETENGYTSSIEALGEYEEYKNQINDDNYGVYVNIDAEVTVPDTEQMSVYRVKPAEITQEFLSNVVNTLAPDIEFHDALKLYNATKSELEKTIKDYRQGLENAQDEDSRAYYQQVLKDTETAYENATDDIDLGDKIECVLTEKEYNGGMAGDAAEQYEAFYGAGNSKDGDYITLYMQNFDSYGNFLSFRKSRLGYIKTDGLYPDSCNIGGWKDEVEVSRKDFTTAYAEECENLEEALYEYEEDQSDISFEAAYRQAEELMKALNLTDYAYFEGYLYNEAPEFIRSDRYVPVDRIAYRKIYKFRFLRNMNNVYSENRSEKHVEGFDDAGNYVKKFWGGESVDIYVNGNGIVGFDYFRPLEVVEELVDQSAIKGFEEVKDIFENMVVATYATDTQGGPFTEIDIDKIYLEYTRISEADTYDTGLLVPVWSFIGTNRFYLIKDVMMSQIRDTDILTINAIDGTVINTELGY